MWWILTFAILGLLGTGYYLKEKIYFYYSIYFNKFHHKKLKNSKEEEARINRIIGDYATQTFGFDISHYQNKEDIKWGKNIGKVLKNEEAGDVGQYNLGQKGVYWVVTICLLALVVTGVIMWRPFFADYFPIPVYRAAILIHSLSAIGLILMIVVHAYAAIWVKGSVRAMVEGWVTRGWARKHHPRWYRELVAKEKQQQ